MFRLFILATAPSMAIIAYLIGHQWTALLFAFCFLLAFIEPWLPLTTHLEITPIVPHRGPVSHMRQDAGCPVEGSRTSISFVSPPLIAASSLPTGSVKPSFS